MDDQQDTGLTPYLLLSEARGLCAIPDFAFWLDWMVDTMDDLSDADPLREVLIDLSAIFLDIGDFGGLLIGAEDVYLREANSTYSGEEAEKIERVLYVGQRVDMNKPLFVDSSGQVLHGDLGGPQNLERAQILQRSKAVREAFPNNQGLVDFLIALEDVVRHGTAVDFLNNNDPSTPNPPG